MTQINSASVVVDQTSSSEPFLDFYTSLPEAKAEIAKRWADQKLAAKINEFLKNDIPEVLLSEPRAVITRQVTTPNEEFYQFINLAGQLGIKPLGWEYHEDVFVTTSPEKASLGRIGLIRGYNKKQEALVSYKKIIDLTGKEEKKPLKDIKTLWGEDLIRFHHRMLRQFTDGIELYDASSWYNSNGDMAKKYYCHFLALFLRNGVMFEDFLLKGHEQKFTYDIVAPAFKIITDIFGIKPLVIPIFTGRHEPTSLDMCYRDDLSQYFHL